VSLAGLGGAAGRNPVELGGRDARKGPGWPGPDAGLAAALRLDRDRGQTLDGLEHGGTGLPGRCWLRYFPVPQIVSALAVPVEPHSCSSGDLLTGSDMAEILSK